MFRLGVDTMDPMKEIYKGLKYIKEGLRHIPDFLFATPATSLGNPSMFLDMSNLHFRVQKDSLITPTNSIEIEQENNVMSILSFPSALESQVKISDYEELLRRLNLGSILLQEAGIHPKLKNLISEKNLNAIYRYFVESRTKEQEIKSLESGEALRFSKEETGLARTLNIIRSKSGEYKLILETKQKLADDTKQPLPEDGGAFKRGKPAWNLAGINGEQIEYFNAVVKIKNRLITELKNLEEEVKVSQYFNEDSGINVTQLGKCFLKTKGSFSRFKVSVYSEKADSNLLVFFNQHYLNLLDSQKSSMMLDLLQALKLFHDKNLVHQDIKLQNILVYQKSQNVYTLKLTDFGWTRIHGQSNEQANAACAYQSPEIEYVYSKDSIENHQRHEYFKNYAALGKYLYQANMMSSINREDCKLPHKANDIWALGIVLYTIKYGKEPKGQQDFEVIKKDPLLSQMLRCNRVNRCDIDTAILLHEKSQKQESFVNGINPRTRI